MPPETEENRVSGHSKSSQTSPMPNRAMSRAPWGTGLYTPEFPLRIDVAVELGRVEVGGAVVAFVADEIAVGVAVVVGVKWEDGHRGAEIARVADAVGPRHAHDADVAVAVEAAATGKRR